MGGGWNRYCVVHVEVHSECDVQVSACTFFLINVALFLCRFLLGLDSCLVQSVYRIFSVENDLIKLIGRAAEFTGKHYLALFS